MAMVVLPEDGLTIVPKVRGADWVRAIGWMIVALPVVVTVAEACAMAGAASAERAAALRAILKALRIFPIPRKLTKRPKSARFAPCSSDLQSWRRLEMKAANSQVDMAGRPSRVMASHRQDATNIRPQPSPRGCLSE